MRVTPSLSLVNKKTFEANSLRVVGSAGNSQWQHWENETAVGGSSRPSSDDGSRSSWAVEAGAEASLPNMYMKGLLPKAPPGLSDGSLAHVPPHVLAMYLDALLGLDENARCSGELVLR